MATGRVPSTANSPLTAKGDLFTYDTSQARLAVGSNGDTLLADGAATTGLRWQPSKIANAAFNSAFDIWQRGTSIAISASGNYIADRWRYYRGTTGSTGSRSTDVPTGFTYSAKIQRDSGNTATNDIYIGQALENSDSARFVGQTVTMSYWAKAGANFSGASSQIYAQIQTGTGTDQAIFDFTGTATSGGLQTITTSWTRYTVTATLSGSAKQVGYRFYYTPVGTAGADDAFYITGIQFELGSVATAWSRAGNTLAGELALAMRYYQRFTASVPMIGFASSTTIAQFVMNYKVPMRNTSLTLGQSTMGVWDVSSFYSGGTWGIAASGSDSAGISFSRLTYQHGSGVLTQFRPYLAANTDANSYLEVSAEL